MPIEVKFQDLDGVGKRSNPARDIAHLWPQLLQHVAARCLKEAWQPELAAILEPAGITTEDMNQAMLAMYRFCQVALDPEVKHPKYALTSVGFFEAKPLAQFAVTALIGEICAGAFWAGVRSATPLGVEPESIKEIGQLAAQSSASWRKD